MPAAYLIVESNISDAEKFKAYLAAAPAEPGGAPLGP